VGSDTMAERRKKRKYKKKGKGKEQAVEPAAAASSSFDSSSSSSSSSAASACATDHHDHGDNDHDDDDDDDPPPPPPVPAEEAQDQPQQPRINIRTAPNGMFDLETLLPDDIFANDNPHLWEGFDPGLTTLYQGNYGTKMSRKQWRFETGADRAVRKANQRNMTIQPVLEQLSHASLKSANARTIAACLTQVWIPNWDRLWAHFGARWWGQQRFKQMVKHQRVLDSIANDVLGPDHRRIAVFGNAVFAPSTPGQPPAPVTKIRNYLARKGRVVLVDEFRTSKTCHACLNLTEQNVKMHVSKHCKNVCHWTWNRDVNGARNIGTLFRAHMAGLPRPAIMCRGL